MKRRSEAVRAGRLTGCGMAVQFGGWSGAFERRRVGGGQTGPALDVRDGQPELVHDASHQVVHDVLQAGRLGPARVFMLQGTTIMPSVRKEPDEIGAAWSPDSAS
ncbi:hypothetical protein GCM10022419_120030 [Nonomuraea rosea]|uniref:Uncharacterized protein n=1 Tax=Nonomuraea rosea TaxID=638574 RepID=A0ABP6ZQ43_9ACTN